MSRGVEISSLTVTNVERQSQLERNSSKTDVQGMLVPFSDVSDKETSPLERSEGTHPKTLQTSNE